MLKNIRLTDNHCTLCCPIEQRGFLTGTDGSGNHDQMGPKQVTKRHVSSGRRSGREKLACERGYLVILKEKFHLGKREREMIHSLSALGGWEAGPVITRVIGR